MIFRCLQIQSALCLLVQNRKSFQNLLNDSATEKVRNSIKINIHKLRMSRGMQIINEKPENLPPPYEKKVSFKYQCVIQYLIPWFQNQIVDYIINDITSIPRTYLSPISFSWTVYFGYR